MHIHGNQMNLNAVNPYSAAAEKAAGAQRAADVRKKLMRSAGEVQGASSPEEALMAGQWMNPRQIPAQSDIEYHTAAAGRDSDFG